jgi:hypothetical protein
MTERGSDIEFDFFDDDPVTQESQARPRQPRRGASGPPRGPRRPQRPTAGLTPLLRLIGLIAFAILIVVLLVVWVQSCRSEGKRNKYESYMETVRSIAANSEQVGRDLNVLLTTPGIKQAELQSKLGGLAQNQEQGVANARELTPPGTLREEHAAAIEALEFRVSGLRLLQDAFRESANLNDSGEAGVLLAAQVQRLLASDVVWSDRFRAPAVAELRRQDITGVEVPDSTFLANVDLATQRGMTPVWQRVTAAQTGGTTGGLHGNGIVSVKVLPAGQVLRTDQDNTVTATADLAFEVTIENSGSSQEVQVGVRLTVQQNPPISKRAVVDLINRGERKTVVFRDIAQDVQFAQRVSVRVQVEPVTGEKNLTNNVASYPVIFTLPPPA